MWKIKTGNETSCLTGRGLLPAVFIFAVLRHGRVVKQDEAGVARNDGRLAGLGGVVCLVVGGAPRENRAWFLLGSVRLPGAV